MNNRYRTFIDFLAFIALYIMRIELLEKIKKLSSDCIKAQRDSERWNDKCTDLPPRM